MAQDTLAQMILDAGQQPSTGSVPVPLSMIDQMIEDAKVAKNNPTQKPKGTTGSTAGDVLNAVASGFNRGITRLAGVPVDTAANIMDLGKAALGGAYGVATGKPPPGWLEVQPRSQVMGSGDWLLSQAAKNPISSAAVNPINPDYEGGYSQATGAGLSGILAPRNAADALVQAARNVAGSTTGKYAGDVTGNPALAISASMMPFAVSRPTIAPLPTARSQVLADAQAKGFVVPPSAAGNTSWTNSALEAFAGKAPLNQDVNFRNLQTRSALAGEQVGIPSGTPVTAEALTNLRNTAGAQGYAPINAINTIPTTPNYANAILAMEQKYGRPSSIVTSLQNPTVSQLATDVIPPSFTGPEINSLIKNLRETGNKQAGASYGSNPATQELGSAQVDTSRALENLVNEHLMNQGPSNVVPNLLEARKNIAQNYTVNKALTNPESGEVNAAPFVTRYQKGLPLEGNQQLIGQFGSMFPTANRSGVTLPSPQMSTGDVYTALLAGGAGGLASGDIKGALPGLIPTLRAPVRHMLLSDWYQQNFANPSGTKGSFGDLTPEQQGALARTMIGSGLTDKGTP